MKYFLHFPPGASQAGSGGRRGEYTFHMMQEHTHAGERGVAHKPLVLASSFAGTDAMTEIAAGLRPRLDYLVIAERLSADWLDTSINRTLPLWRRNVERVLASDLTQAQAAWARAETTSAWLSTSERVGLPLALRPSRGVPHVLIAHNLLTGRKRWLNKLTGVLPRFDAIICLAEAQMAFLRETIPPERAHRVWDNVDDLFFRPAPGDPASGDYILAVGRENRDYPTLIEAARHLRLPLTIVSSSLWSSQKTSVPTADIPPNVTLRTEFVSYPELRTLYEGARLVVVPLKECGYAAGVNGALEAMAMGKAAVVSATRGLSEYLEDGQSNAVAPPGDAAALASVIQRLWNDAPARRALGRAARRRVEAVMSMDIYADRVAAIVREAQAARRLSISH